MGRRRNKQSGPGVLLFLLPLLLVLVGGIIWRVRQELVTSRLGDGERRNLVLIQDNPVLLSLDRRDKSLTVVFLPGDLYFPLAGGYGNYRISTSYSVGNLDRRGGQVVMATIAGLVGVPIDGYVKLPDGFAVSPPDNIRSRLEGGILQLGNSQTNLSVWDFVRWSWELRQLRFDRVKMINLAKLGVTSEIVLADGSRAQTVDLDRLDYLLAGDFNEEDLRSEGLKVEVLNTSDQAGLGARAARIINSVGGNVVRVDNANLPVSGCEVRVTSERRGSLTVKRLTEIFGCPVVVNSPGQADVTLILRSLRLDGLML